MPSHQFDIGTSGKEKGVGANASFFGRRESPR